MLFGRSVFQSILTRLDSEAEEQATPSPAAASDFRVNGLNAGFVVENTSHASCTQAAEAYLDFGQDDPSFEEKRTQSATSTPPASEIPPRATPKEPPAPIIPAYLLRLTEAEIAQDLGLSPRDTADAAHEKRRQFAKTNHPDRVAPPFREQATRRMTIANTLVDRFLKTTPSR